MLRGTSSLCPVSLSKIASSLKTNPVGCFACVRAISSSPVLNQVQKLTRMRVVDNSNLGKQAMLEGKPPKVIHVYRTGSRGHPAGYIGDKVMVAIKGHKKKGIIVGCTQRQDNLIPKFDSNNLVLVNDEGNPLGTRILVPIPHILRKRPELQKLIAIATSFV